MRAARGDPALQAGGQIRHRAPHDAGDRQVRHLHDRLDALDVLADQAQTAAHVDQADDDRVALAALEHQARRVLLVHADAQVMRFNARLRAGHARADLEHVRAQAVFLARNEVIGVVLHEGGAAGLALGNGLEDRGHRGDLPVALAAVAVALGHQVLGSQTRQLLHAVEVLERVGERLAALGVEHLADGNLLARLIADRVHVLGGDVVRLGIDRHHRVDLFLGHGVHHLDQIAGGPGVHLPAQLGLHLDLVALGDGHLAHVVAKAHDLEALGEGHADGGAHPAAQALLNGLVLPVAGDDLARHAQARGDEAVLAVAMGGLVQVHEVHVDLFVGDLQVVLRGKVAVGLLQVGEAVDPHLARGEGVAPGDDAGALLVVVRLADDVGDLLVGLRGDLVDQLAGQVAGGVQRVGHLRGALSDGLKDLRAVEELAADDEPEFVLLHAHG